ncbi:hypothetical protein TSUD_376870 [Trifolium subterraneum]|uniref:Uncharacterized protein n=1 Tax=Trifolium subterraneum TaxID=3900 RepID=A0A2Z6LVG0_TRISU|nr:hypothetical protein TSUD_376870 [Trifolium subterraneum]
MVEICSGLAPGVKRVESEGDCWKWGEDSCAVKSAYQLKTEGEEEEDCNWFKDVWNPLIPSNMSTLALKLEKAGLDYGDMTSELSVYINRLNFFPRLILIMSLSNSLGTEVLFCCLSHLVARREIPRFNIVDTLIASVVEVVFLFSRSSESRCVCRADLPHSLAKLAVLTELCSLKVLYACVRGRIECRYCCIVPSRTHFGEFAL